MGGFGGNRQQPGVRPVRQRGGASAWTDGCIAARPIDAPLVLSSLSFVRRTDREQIANWSIAANEEPIRS